MRGEFSFKRNLLFDLDGTLVDSTVAHAQAYLDALRPRHSELAATFQYARVAGQPTRQVFAQMGIVEPELTALTRSKQEHFRAALGRGEVDVFPGVMDLLEGLRGLNRRLFLVTGASRISAQRMLGSAKLTEFFEAIVTGEDDVAGKPSPEPYLRILGDHQLRAEVCLAIEDAESGVRSAQAAGIDVVLIHSALEVPGVNKVRDCAELAELLLL